MGNWIRCDQQMPPVYKQVLAYGPSRGEMVGGVEMEICVWDGDTWWDEGGTEMSISRTSNGWADRGWTHWMPLPDPPLSDTPSQPSAESDARS